jgi:ATP-binding protein involved in chromosome partitioning
MRRSRAGVDPRPFVIEERLSPIGRIIPVTGGKGGIGKSVISSCLALSLRQAGAMVGLLDLDFSSPTLHVILGAGDRFPREEKGIVPPKVHGIELMSMSFYSGDSPAPLRGADFSNAMIELLAITRWGKLDFLIVDMPPGITDPALDTLRLMKRAQPLLVTIPSKLALETLRRMVRMFKELRVGMLGVVENMCRDHTTMVLDEMARLQVGYLCKVGYDPELEAAIGQPDKLLLSRALRDLKPAVNAVYSGHV